MKIEVLINLAINRLLTESFYQIKKVKYSKGIAKVE